jgi:prepilin-type N-terminal cleavage/methylation domain-containing protein
MVETHPKGEPAPTVARVRKEQETMQREHLGARAVRPEEDGFTLLELMMVMLIIGILITVLTPIFLGATTRAKDRAMEASLRNAATGAKSLYLANADYTQVTPASLSTELGALTFVGPGTLPSGQNSISVFGFTPTRLFLSGQSKSGMCFYLTDDQTTGLTQYAKQNGAAGCPANTSPPPGDPAWQSTW